MTSTNLALVKEIYAAWERGDLSSADWAHPDIECSVADGPTSTTSKGLAGMARLQGDFLRAWKDWRVEADEYRELDDERVVVLFRFSARGRTSGLEVSGDWTKGASVFHLRDGRVTRLVQYLNRERGLADLGIEAG